MNPYLKRIRARLFWLSFLGLALAGTLFVLSQWVYGATDDQCTWQLDEQAKKVRILEILPDGVAEEAGLLDGDELLAIQGRRVRPTPDGTDEAQRLIDSKEEGTVLSYTIRRREEGKEPEVLQVPVRLVKPIRSFLLALLLNGVVFWAVGLLVVLSSPERKSSRHMFYLGCCTLLLVGVAPSLSRAAPEGLRAAALAMGTLAFALLPPLWIHFFSRFPFPFAWRRDRRVLLALYGGFACLALARFVLLTLGSEPGLGEPTRKALAAAARGLMAWPSMAALLGGLALFMAGSRRVPQARRDFTLLPLVVAGAVVLDLLVLVILSVLHRDSLIFQRKQWIFMAALPLLPLSFGIAVVRHGLFEVGRPLLRGLAFFALAGLAFAIYLAGLSGLFQVGATWVNPSLLGVLAGLLVIPMGWLLRSQLLRIRRRYGKDHTAIREQILGALRESSQRLSEEGLVRHMAEAIREAYRPQCLHRLNAEQGFLSLPGLERTDDEGLVTRYPMTTLKLPPGLLRHARDNRELVVGLGSEEADWIREQDPKLREHVDALGAQVMVLLMAHERPHTALLLGGKYAERGYSREDRELLREAAIGAGVMLETVQLHRRVVEQERLSQELAAARRIQEGLLPKAPEIPGFQVALRLEAALETGGDLLFLKQRPDGRWVAAVGDVSGKGLPAALYMGQAVAMLDLAVGREGAELEAILPRLDETLRHLLGPKGFLTLALLEWDATGAFRLARAGHPGALLLEPGAPARELAPPGRGLGLRPAGPGHWVVQEGVLPPRAWVVLYSDGLTEAMDRQGELFGVERMSRQLQRLLGTGSVRAACEAVFQEVGAFETQNREPEAGAEGHRTGGAALRAHAMEGMRDDRTLFILAREAA